MENKNKTNYLLFIDNLFKNLDDKIIKIEEMDE